MNRLRGPIKALLIDLSGTIYIEDAAIPGAIEALKRLRETRIPIKFVTNTTMETRQFLYDTLHKIGFDIQADEIWTSLWAARDLVVSRKLKPYLMLEEAAMADFSDIEFPDGEYDSVVVGLAPSMFDYYNLTKAFRLLLKGAPLIAIHESKYYKKKEGLVLGPGPFVKGLQYAADCKSEVVGKPSPTFFQSALGNIDPRQAVMIGDDVRIDIGGAQELGMQGILVQTGKYRPGDENKISPPPCEVCPNFTHAVEKLLQVIKSS
ncbi:haloacid dehalogenase-like hydrolase domain-containing protein 2 [Anabrus simplex]|uniref:haloacid dehalogenase-like hydrolase domain-containing protein 2 n=1 Tax=Anabrus simplex TaxID=316456 RepID=UPI0035A36C3B